MHGLVFLRFSVSLIYLSDVPLDLTVPFNLCVRGDECDECVLPSAAPPHATSFHIYLLCPHPPCPPVSAPDLENELQ